jgi:hypothetical protein
MQGLGDPQFLELPGRLRVVIPIHDHMPRIATEPGTTRGAGESSTGQPWSTSRIAASSGWVADSLNLALTWICMAPDRAAQSLVRRVNAKRLGLLA